MTIVNKKKIAELLKTKIDYFTIEQIEDLIEIPPTEFPFTHAFPCFRLSKFEKKKPDLLASELRSKIVLPEYLAEIQSKGAYLNFRVKPELVLLTIMKMEEEYGKLETKSITSRTIVIEYPSPNTNKPLHLGHIRNILLGSTMSNIYKYIGHKIFQVNLNNDRGIHICKSMLWYKKWGKNKEPNQKSDHFVGQAYVNYHTELEKNESLAQEAKDILLSWENNDPNTRALWKKMSKWALEGFKETYEKFSVTFDKEYFESDFYWKGKDKITEALEKGIFEKDDDGAIIARLKDKYDLPDKVLLRSDGTTIYVTQDIYLAYLKKEDFHYDTSIYVVGNEQDLYFKQLFAILDAIGFKEEMYHFSYGMISLPGGKMKSREGRTVDADDLVDEMFDLAYGEVSNRYTDLSEEEKRYRANVIGKAALRFFILKFDPKSDFMFNPNESIKFKGETGPYIQYCYARIQSIIFKSKETITSSINYEILSHEKELLLIKLLHQFPGEVYQAATTHGIHLIPQYLLSLCQAFNSFYNDCVVISDDKEVEKARLLLIRCVQIIIKSGLNLLGIETLDEM
ncbi:MAG: arginine--tRNA ligase [Promethearchaeota archaeon]